MRDEATAFRPASILRLLVLLHEVAEISARTSKMPIRRLQVVKELSNSTAQFPGSKDPQTLRD